MGRDIIHRDSTCERIVDFVKPYYDESYKQIRDNIKKHIKLGTILYPKDNNGEFIGVVIWNIRGYTAFVESVVVNPKYQRGKVLKLLIAQGWTRFKWVKFIAFERRLKENDRGMRVYRITQFL